MTMSVFGGRSQRLRIVYYVPQLEVGGTEKHVYELATRLDHARFEPHVWCPGPWGPIGDQLVEKGVPVHRTPLPHRTWSVLSLVKSLKLLRRLRPAIFHSFGYGAHVADALLAQMAGVPIYISSRRNVRHWDLQGRLRLSERIRNRWTDIVIANSQAAASCAIDIESICQSHVRVIYTGLDLPSNDFSTLSTVRKECGVPPQGLVIGNVANLKEVKGHSILLQAMVKVVDSNSLAHLIIVGDGEERNRLNASIAEKGLIGRVHLLGFRSDLSNIYRNLDLYVHSSLAEGFPTAVLEAMSYGVPVVATAAGGTAESVENNVTGLTVPPGDVSQLADAMIKVLLDRKLRDQMGSAGRKRVATRFALSRMLNEYEEIYLECLHRRKVTHPCLCS